MIEQLIKENTEAMRELIAVLRGSHVAQVVEAMPVSSATQPVVAAPVEVKQPEPTVVKPTVQQDKPKTRAEIQAAMIKLCQTPEGKKTAREALDAVGRARFSEITDDELDVFVGRLTA